MIPLNDSNGILNGSNGVNLSVQAVSFPEIG